MDILKLYEDNYSSFSKYAASILINPSFAEDVVQDVFIRIHQISYSLQNNNSMYFYLKQAVKNASLKKNRDSPTLCTLENIQIIEEEEYVHIPKIDDLLKTLPKIQKKVILMRVKEYSLKEIAEELNLSVNTIKTHIRLAKANLKISIKHNYCVL